MASDRQTLLAEANASAKRNLMSVGGCADAPVGVDTAGNADGKRPCLGNGQTVLMRTSTQADFVECRSEAIIRNDLSSPREAIIRNCLPPALVDDPLFRKALVTTSRMGQTAVCMDKGTSLGKRDTTLPHRQTFTRKIIPTTDKRLDQENMTRLNLPQGTWIETFLEGVTDKSTGLPLFSELAWFVYKVSCVMCSASACEHYWSIEGWIHSQRRNRLDQKLVEKLVRAHTNLVLRESLDDTLRDLLPWDIELVIDESVDEQEEEPEA
jgi:hypothetical protein